MIHFLQAYFADGYTCIGWVTGAIFGAFFLYGWWWEKYGRFGRFGPYRHEPDLSPCLLRPMDEQNS
jgi:hypothetical protein